MLAQERRVDFKPWPRLPLGGVSQCARLCSHTKLSAEENLKEVRENKEVGWQINMDWLEAR